MFLAAETLKITADFDLMTFEQQVVCYLFHAGSHSLIFFLCVGFSTYSKQISTVITRQISVANNFTLVVVLNVLFM